MLTLEDDFDKGKTNLADVIEEFIVNQTKVPSETNLNENFEGHICSHLATTYDENVTASFISTLQGSIVSHVGTAVMSNRQNGVFEGVLIITSAASGSTSGGRQYLAYFSFIKREPDIGVSRAAI